MTKHAIVKFQLARSAVAMLAGGGAGIAALLVGAGYIAGSVRAAKKAQPPAAATAPAAASTLTATAATASAPTPPAETFTLRVKLVASEEEAKAVQAELRKKAIDAAVVALPPQGGTTLYSVETGSYPSRAEAAAGAAALRDKSDVETVVVPKPPA